MQYLEKKPDYFEVPSFGAQQRLLQGRCSPAASVVYEGQAPSDASAVVDGAGDDDGWDLDGAVGLGELERVVLKGALCDF